MGAKANMDSMVPASKISDMPSGWICGQVARDFTPTKTGRHCSMNIQKSEEFQTSKFYCKTNFDMAEIKAEEEDYANYPLPIAYDFKSVDARERILNMNYNRVKADMNQLIIEIQQKLKVTKIQKQDNKDYAYYNHMNFFQYFIAYLDKKYYICMQKKENSK